jgi:hypothetical protein
MLSILSSIMLRFLHLVIETANYIRHFRATVFVAIDHGDFN